MKNNNQLIYTVNLKCLGYRCDTSFIPTTILIQALPPGYDLLRNGLAVFEQGDNLISHVLRYPSHTKYSIYNCQEHNVGELSIEGKKNKLFFLHPEGPLLDEMTKQFLEIGGNPYRLR